MRIRRSALLPLLLMLPAQHAAAQICNVPAQRSSIHAAVLDPDCAVVNVAAGNFVESVAVTRSLWINGAATQTTIVQGRVLVRGSGVVLDLTNLSVDARGAPAGCYDAIEVASGSGLRPSAVATLSGPAITPACPLFTDSFDYGY